MNLISALTIAPLRSDLCITPQDHSANGKVMVSHPLTGKVFLFPQRSFQILQGLRLGESIEDVMAREAGTANPSSAIEAAVVTLLRQSWSAGLLQDGAPAHNNSSRIRWNPFFLRIPLANPEILLDRLNPLARGLFSVPALILWLAAMAAAMLQLHAHGQEYLTCFPAFGRFTAWPLFYVLWGGSALLHEFGHVLACIRRGLRVREIGLLFYMFYPGAYANVSSAWTLPSATQRIIISLGGLYIDSLLWMGALECWRFQGIDTLAGQTAFIFSVVLSTRIAVNLIPFLRMDGYWVLSDLLRIPNLRARAYAYLWSLVCPPRWNFVRGSRQVRKNATPGEACIFAVYGLLALVFTAFMGYAGILAMVHALAAPIGWFSAALQNFLN